MTSGTPSSSTSRRVRSSPGKAILNVTSRTPLSRNEIGRVATSECSVQAGYWRPTGFATAVVLADALVFEGAGEDLAAELLHVDELDQLLLRALLFRLVTDRLARPDEPVAPAYSAAVELALRLTARR